MLWKLAAGEVAFEEVVTGEIVLGKLRWGNDLTKYYWVVLGAEYGWGEENDRGDELRNSAEHGDVYERVGGILSRPRKV